MAITDLTGYTWVGNDSLNLTPKADTTLYAKWVAQELKTQLFILNNKPLKLNNLFLGIKSTPPSNG